VPKSEVREALTIAIEYRRDCHYKSAAIIKRRLRQSLLIVIGLLTQFVGATLFARLVEKKLHRNIQS
jgi:hypothetical protein